MLLLKKIYAFYNNEENSKPKKLLYLAFIIGLLVVFFQFVSVQDIIHAIKEADTLYLLYGTLAIVPFLLFEAMQFQVLLSRQKIHLPAFHILSLNLKIRFFQTFAPGSIAGSGIRIYYYSQETQQPSAIIASLTYYKIYSFVLNLLFGGVFWGTSVSSELQTSFLILSLFSVISIVALIALPFISSLFASRLVNTVGFGKKSVKGWIISELHKILGALADFSTLTWQHQTKMVLLSIFSQITALLSYYWLAVAIGMHLNLVDMGWIRAVILFSLYLPINVSAGITVREIGFAALLIAIGIPGSIAGAYSLLILVRTNLIALTGGAIELVKIFSKTQLSERG